MRKFYISESVVGAYFTHTATQATHYLHEIDPDGQSTEISVEYDSQCNLRDALLAALADLGYSVYTPEQ